VLENEEVKKRWFLGESQKGNDMEWGRVEGTSIQ